LKKIGEKKIEKINKNKTCNLKKKQRKEKVKLGNAAKKDKKH
jgi:hypothetical protein